MFSFSSTVRTFSIFSLLVFGMSSTAVGLTPTRVQVSARPFPTSGEALMLEATVKQGSDVISGRVLMQAGETRWTSVATSAVTKSGTPLRLEARAAMLEPDVVEIETRIRGASEENAKMIVRFGERADMNIQQMESSSPQTKRPDTSLGVKVVKVRYNVAP